jgi:hypothetical protein
LPTLKPTPKIINKCHSSTQKLDKQTKNNALSCPIINQNSLPSKINAQLMERHKKMRLILIRNNKRSHVEGAHLWEVLTKKEIHLLV